jgi:hypothetical protein
VEGKTAATDDCHLVAAQVAHRISHGVAHHRSLSLRLPACPALGNQDTISETAKKNQERKTKKN